MGKDICLDSFNIIILDELMGEKGVIWMMSMENGTGAFLIVGCRKKWLSKLRSCLPPYLGHEAGNFFIIGVTP